MVARSVLALLALAAAPAGATSTLRVAGSSTVLENEWCFCIMPTIVPENPPSAASVAYAAAPLPAGGLALAGSEPRGDRPGLGAGWQVRALDATSAVRWSRSLGWAEEFHEVARAAAADATGRLVVAGYAEHARGTPIPARWLVAAYGPAGATLWHDDLAAEQPLRAEAVAITSSGNAVVAGWRSDGPAAGSHWLIRAYAPDGRVLWTRTVGGRSPGPSGAHAVAAGADGRVIVAGNLIEGGGALSAWCLRAYDAGGALLWSRTQVEPGAWLDAPYAVAVAPGGRIAAAGKIAGPPADRGNWAVRVYDADGTPAWSATRDGGKGLDDKAYAVAFDACGRVVAAGYDDGDAAQKPPFDAGHWAAVVYAPGGALVREIRGRELGVAPGGGYGLARGPGGVLTLAGYEQTEIPGKTRWAFRALDLPPCP